MRVLEDKVLVEPWWDADRIGLIWLPDSAKNNQPQQGEVLGAGPLSGVESGQHIMFHPWRGEWHYMDGKHLLLLRRKDLTAEIRWIQQVPFLCPLRDHVMVDPDWADKYTQPSKTIFVPETVLEQNQPVLRGTITELGKDLLRIRRDYYVGAQIFIQPGKGSEVGWGYDRKVYYFIRPKHILARIDDGLNAPNAPIEDHPAESDPDQEPPASGLR
jgi:co-chaperonin GroES (HSP10)